jgi:hypothetical protein
MIKALWLAIKRLLGFPMPPSDEQKTEQLITMREKRDCAVAAVATACRVTYEAAHKALCHWDLPFFLESPLLSNPLNMLRALRDLGFDPDEKSKISELLRSELPPGKTICLVHNPDGAIKGTLQQHWVVYMGRSIYPDGEYLFHWGQDQTLKAFRQQEVIDMLTAGWPNCVITLKTKTR